MPYPNSRLGWIEVEKIREQRCLEQAAMHRAEWERLTIEEAAEAAAPRNPLVCPCVPDREPCADPCELARIGAYTNGQTSSMSSAQRDSDSSDAGEGM